jgi:sugar transferase (PEP-CTERM/EpsH1 system associated)
MKGERIHVVHVVNRFGVGGMENVVVQLINRLPQQRFRHSVVAITELVPEFAARIAHADVELHALGKRPGQPFWRYPAMYRLLRRLRPDVWHSCNLAALEFAPVALAAGVPWRIHAEHGLELDELEGRNMRYRWLRRLLRGFAQVHVAVSEPIAEYLHAGIGVAATRIARIGNGVDLQRYRPWAPDEPIPAGYPFVRGLDWVIGSVGRQEPIKNPLLLVEAFIALVRTGAAGTDRLRLAMVGQGSLHAEIGNRMTEAGLADRLWLPGNRDDVDAILRQMDCFVLPSVSEGTSCTLQEALASGVPVVATDVGGNAAVLDRGRVGRLVPSGDRGAMVRALQACMREEGGNLSTRIRAHAEKAHDLGRTVEHYRALFDRRKGA